MRDDIEIAATFAARCTGCGNVYGAAVLLFLYSDELGYRCHECGSILTDDFRSPENVPPACHLLLPGEMENSRLHAELERMTEGEDVLVLLDVSDEMRTIRPKPCLRAAR